VKKWANSAVVRVSASVMEAMHLDLDEVVEVREEKGRIAIEPVREKTYVLDDLRKGSAQRTCMKQLISGLKKANRSGDGKSRTCLTPARLYGSTYATGLS
jgi:antitoxin MazE